MSAEEYVEHGHGEYARIRRRVIACLQPLGPRGARFGVGFSAVAVVLPAFLLGARLGLGLGWTASAGAATAAWLPVALWWWNRYAEHEDRRVRRVCAGFGDRFPAGSREREDALAVLVGLALSPAHRLNAAAGLLLTEMGEEARLDAARAAAPEKTVSSPPPQALAGDGGPAPESATPPESPPEAGPEQSMPPDAPPAPGARPAASAPAPAPASDAGAPPDAILLEPEAGAGEGSGEAESGGADYMPLEPDDPTR